MRVEGLSRHFGAGESRVEVLHDVTFSVARGARCVIVGASGSGKSTLLNAIGGLDAPDAGTIHVAGEQVTGRSPRELTRYRRAHVGFVFQFYNLVPDLTVTENIQVTAQLPGASPETMAASVASILERQFSTIAGVTTMTSTSSPLAGKPAGM